jgi:hypothetical protein
VEWPLKWTLSQYARAWPEHLKLLEVFPSGNLHGPCLCKYGSTAVACLPQAQEASAEAKGATSSAMAADGKADDMARRLDVFEGQLQTNQSQCRKAMGLANHAHDRLNVDDRKRGYITPPLRMPH